MQLLIMNAHSLGPKQSAQLLSIPRHEIELSEVVARELYQTVSSEYLC